jgi:hypothetical protein
MWTSNEAKEFKGFNASHTRKQLYLNIIKSSIKLLNNLINVANIDLSSKVIIICLDSRKTEMIFQKAHNYHS